MAMSKYRNTCHISISSHHGLADRPIPPLLLDLNINFVLKRNYFLSVLIAHLGKDGWLRMIRQDNSRMGSHTAEAIMFFHRPEHPLPSVPPTSTQAATHSVPTIQQPGSLKPTLNSAPHVSSPNYNSSTGAVKTPLYQPSPTRHVIASPPVAAASMNRGELNNVVERAEEQGDIQMENADYSSLAAAGLVATGPSKGLSGSRWNPANDLTIRAPSACSSQTSLKPGSDASSSTRPVEIITSGLTKGPGLKASR
ncbi:hypothetical protein F5Y14DRAFT_307620 [Nemania sp. NC0429]|nr:hypothetical protein F5Y14DRAFT_307620 [Nemania sp. NC0429]